MRIDRNRRRPAAGEEGENGVALGLGHRGAGERRGGVKSSCRRRPFPQKELRFEENQVA